MTICSLTAHGYEAQEMCVSMPHKRYKSFGEFRAGRAWGLRERLLNGIVGDGIGILRPPMFSQWDLRDPELTI